MFVYWFQNIFSKRTVEQNLIHSFDPKTKFCNIDSTDLSYFYNFSTDLSSIGVHENRKDKATATSRP